MQDLLTDAMEQLLATHCTPTAVRQVERDGNGSALWGELSTSGFLDALVSENRGGAGLSLADVFAIVFACGRHALPLPMAQTLLVRGLCAAVGLEHPAGPITVAGAVEQTVDGGIRAAQVPFGRVCDWVLVEHGSAAMLLPVDGARSTPAGGHGSLDADMEWLALPAQARHLSLDRQYSWRMLSAGLTAALLAGALERVFEKTVAYANERSQFGKPIGKLQAIQQQLSVMAEEVFAAKMAAQIGFDSPALTASPQRAAVAKARTSAAVPTVAAIAHAVHGAMGFTEEYDLQLYTRRLHEWRMAYGSELYWYRELGADALRSSSARGLDYVREQIMAAHAW